MLETCLLSSVCGADVVDRNATIAAVADYIDSFFDDFTEAKEDLLKQVHFLYCYFSKLVLV